MARRQYGNCHRFTRWTSHPGLLVMVVSLGITGCEGIKDQFGLGKSSPDEFSVVTRAPLSLPPDFRLRPPEPGAARPQESSAIERAQAALMGAGRDRGTDGKTVQRSDGESALLSQAGTEIAKSDIRKVINEENAVLADVEDSLVERLIFWRSQSQPGDVVDARKESQRLKENAALGRPPTEGATPVIQRRERAILEGIF